MSSVSIDALKHHPAATRRPRRKLLTVYRYGDVCPWAGVRKISVHLKAHCRSPIEYRRIVRHCQAVLGDDFAQADWEYR